MAQLFSPAANTIAIASLVIGATAPFGILFVGSQISRSPGNTMVDVPLDQPVPFSHKHHVAELGIDCRFCHISVEESAHASLPTTEVCMTCHVQVWKNSPLLEVVRQSYEQGIPIKWNKVHNSVPDFVYFDHSVHIDRGISCNTCHGPIQDMHITWRSEPFFMSWCLECHTDPDHFMVTITPGAAPASGYGSYDDHDHEPATSKLDPIYGDRELTPREQVFLLYEKIAAGYKLTPQEYQIATGAGQRLPKDKVHEGVREMESRGINKTQLKDCWICHR